MLRRKAAELGPGQWITGYGWQEANLAENRNLTRTDLDAGAPDNPVTHNNRANALRRMKRTSEAAEGYGRAAAAVRSVAPRSNRMWRRWRPS